MERILLGEPHGTEHKPVNNVTKLPMLLWKSLGYLIIYH